jgi:biopolymer transport protein ExbD
MRRVSARYAQHRMSELNITPMLDLCFVLLTIFMIAAPFLSESQDLIIPTGHASGTAVDPGKIFTLSVNKDGALTLNDAPLAPEDTASSLRALRQEHPELGLLIRAHKDLPVQSITDLMDTARAAGISKVGIITKSGGTTELTEPGNS